LDGFSGVGNGFVGRGGFGFGFFGLGVGNGFVWEIVAGSFADEALELLDGAAVLPLDLGLVAEGDGPHAGIADNSLEALGHGVVPVLSDVELFVRVEGGVEAEDRGVIVVEDAVEAGDEHAGFEPPAADHHELADGDALDGEDLLGGLGVVVGEGVGAEVVELAVLLEAEHGDVGGGEAVFAGIEGGAGLALGGAGSGGLRGVGPVGSELFFGERLHSRV
jgi:hypothetical protein